MDKNQMEMLSVKNAIERMVQNYINTFNAKGSPNEFFDAVERMVASFFVGQQIDNNYSVKSTERSVEISFSTKGHGTRLTFLLPKTLTWEIEQLQKQSPVTNPELKIVIDEFIKPEGKSSFGDITLKKQEWLSEETQSPKSESVSEVFDPVEAYERAKKAVSNMM